MVTSLDGTFKEIFKICTAQSKSLENNNIGWTIPTIIWDVLGKGLEFLSRHGMQALSKAFWKNFKEVPEKISTICFFPIWRQPYCQWCKLIDRTLLPVGRFQKEKQKLMRRALCVPGSPLAVASVHRARLREPLAVLPFPSSPGQALWCFLVASCSKAWSPLLLPLQKLEDGWACVSHTQVNLSAATFQIWGLSLKYSGLYTLKFLPPKDLFSRNLCFQVALHFPYPVEFRVHRLNQ